MESQGDFVLGTRVRVQGLKSALQHNDKVGVITEGLQDGRVGVKLDDGTSIKVKLENLVMVPVPISDFINQLMVAQVGAAPGQLLVDLPNRQISNLDGVQQLVGLKELRVNNNNIVSLAGVKFPVTLKALLLNENKIENLDEVKFPNSLVILGLSVNKIVSLAGFVFPSSLKTLHLARNRIVSLAGVVFPASLQKLYLYENQIADLERAEFPHNLKFLNLNGNQITSLRGVVFPASLQELYLDTNNIDSLSYVTLPEGLQIFSLLNNQKIKDCTHFRFPLGLLDFSISNASTNCKKLSKKLISFRERIKTSLERNPQARQEFMTTLQTIRPEIFTEGQEEQGLADVTQLMLQRLHNSASASRKCSFCDKEEETGKKLKICGGCRTLYCGIECQKSDWPVHQLVCNQQEEKGKAPATKGAEAEGAEAATKGAEGAAEGAEAEGGNKSKTRRQRRQSKRNKMQRIYKYSRRRRNAKSKSKK